MVLSIDSRSSPGSGNALPAEAVVGNAVTVTVDAEMSELRRGSFATFQHEPLGSAK